MRRQTSKRFRITILAVLAAVIVMAYLEYGFLPGKLKTHMINTIENLTGQRIDFRRAVYIPLRGLRIDRLTFSPKDSMNTFEAGNLRLRLALWPFLRESKIVIREAQLVKPRLRFYQTVGTEDAKISKTPRPTPEILLALLKSGVDLLLPENVYLDKLSIRDGFFRLEERRHGSSVVEIIREINVESDFSQKPKIPYRASYSLGDKVFARVSVEGFWNYDSQTHELHAKGYTKRIPTWFKEEAGLRNIMLGDIQTDFDARFRYEEKETFRFVIETQQSRGEFAWGDFSFNGSFKTDIVGTHDMVLKTTTLERGKIMLANAVIDGLPPPYETMRISDGHIVMRNGAIILEDLQALWNGHAVTLSGNLQTDAPQSYRWEITEEAKDLSILRHFKSEDFGDLFEMFSLKGPVLIRAGIKGTMDGQTSKEKYLRLSPRNATLRLRALDKELTQVQGEASWHHGTLEFDGITFNENGIPWSLKGFLHQDTRRPSKILLENPQFLFDVTLSKRPDFWDVSAFKVIYGSSSLDLKGRILNDPERTVELAGNASIELTNLFERFGEQFKPIKYIQPSGKIIGKSRIDGNLKDASSLELTFRSVPAQIVLNQKFTIRNMEFDLSLKPGVLKITYSKGMLNGGDLRITGSIEKDPKKTRTDMRLQILETDLSQIAGQYDFLAEDLSGDLTLDLHVKGFLEAMETLEGEGRFQIDRGVLWSTPLFRELGDLTLVKIRGMENVTFNDAAGTFRIHNGAIHTQDTVLKSPSINVWIAGKAFLNQELDLRVKSTFTSAVVRQSYELGSMAAYAVGKASGIITQYHVTGTLTDPIYDEV